MLLRQLIGCLAASTLTDDAVTLYFYLVSMNVWPNLPVFEWGNADSETRWAEGIVIMATTFLLAMILVILAWITVVAVSLGLPHTHLRKKAKHCTQAKGHSPALKSKGINHGVREPTQYVRGAMHTSSHFLRKTLFQRITMYLAFALYATVAVIVHLLEIDGIYMSLTRLPFSAYLTWLTTTSSFCFFIWLATLLNHSKTVPELRADVAFALAKSKSICSSIDKIGTIASCILIADSILTVEWPIKILYELMPVYESGDFASILVWVGFWIICIVAASLGLVVNYGMNMPLDAFRRSIQKCQQDMAKDASPKALGPEPKTEKPRSAYIVSKDADFRSSNTPMMKSSTSTFPITESMFDISKTPILLWYSILLARSFWLVILHFTWLEIEFAPGTSMFVYWLCMAPRWWATGFSVLSFLGTMLLGDSLCQEIPVKKQLLNRATGEQTLLLTQATSFIGAFVLSVDIEWHCIRFCKNIYKNLTSYQAGKIRLFWFWYFSPLLVFYFVLCMFLAYLPWIQLNLYRETIEKYNLSLVKLEEELKKTTIATDDHDDPIVPGCGFSPSEIAKTEKQVEVSPLSEKRDGAPGLSGSEDLVENDWQVVEQGSKDGDGSDVSSASAAGVGAGTLFSGIKEAERECDGSTCKWKLLHDEQQTAGRDLKKSLEVMWAEVGECEEALSRLHKEACVLERSFRQCDRCNQ
ncbi:MAG: hypothetical protein ASARMPREDX12_007143 [Alectoria sarmentosa]|nr:MAG: hypothetical protein ASARMPREDX12_007143 [Alectoria sarmentosa]